MNRSTTFLALCALAVPCLASDQVFVTKADGGPDRYVPMASIGAPTLPDDPLDAAAVVHNATVHRAYTPSLTPRLRKTAVPLAAPAASTDYTPPAFNSLSNVVSFIQHQTAGTKGLPLTYYVPGGAPTGNQVVDRGVGTYDTSLALMALIQHGNLSDAKTMLDIYNSGAYGNTVISAYPTANNGGAFQPFDSNAYYYFDFANGTGIYDTAWNQYGSHTGPNAYLALAVCQYIQAQRAAGVSDGALAPYLAMAARLGNAMLALQDSQTQGGVRYGPHASYQDPYDTVNSENDLDAYSAFNAIANVMRASTLAPYAGSAARYSTGAGKVLGWLQYAQFYNPVTGKTQYGIRDPQTGLLYVGAVFQNNRWEIQPQLAADSGASLAISALGPQMIDAIWGRGAAYQMWQAARANFGRTESTPGDPSTIRNAGPNDPLVGMDYTNSYPADQGLISPEWTGEAVHAAKQLVAYYGDPVKNNLFGAADDITAEQFTGLSADLASMQQFLGAGPTAYAIGPGLTGSRGGNTGFGWQSTAPTNAAMAAIYGQLTQDPLHVSAAYTPPTTPQTLHFHVTNIYGTQDYDVTIPANGVPTATTSEIDGWNSYGSYSLGANSPTTTWTDGSLVLLGWNKALQSVLIDLNTRRVVWLSHMTGQFPIIDQSVTVN